MGTPFYRKGAERPAVSRPRTWAGPVLLAVAALVLPTPCRAGDEPRQAADAAYESGDHAQALELYDAALARDPQDKRALMRSALLLSWDRRFEEALQRYDRLLTLDPADRTAAFERAKVLSWDGRYGAAIAAFRQLLAEGPDDRELRLALARALAWKGNYAGSREEFARLLAADPEDAGALVGTAQTWAWAGRLDEARRWYERALAVDPDQRDAKLGLAYLHLWTGDAATADALARELVERHPDSDDVGELAERARRAAGPSLRVAADRVDDTDENRLVVYRAAAGWRLGRSLGLTLDGARYEMADPLGQARIDSFGATLDVRLALDQSLALRLGVDRSERTDGSSDTVTLGGARYTHGIGHAWQWSVAAARDALRYSPTITDNGIVIDDYRAELRGHVGDRWRVFVDGGRGDFSDDNRRDQLQAGFAYRLPPARPRLEAGFAWRYLDYSDDLDNGYFDPQRFRAGLAQLRGSGRLRGDRTTYTFGIDYGLQSFTLGGVRTSDDTVVVLSGTLDLPLARSTSLQLFAGWGDYAAQTASGFESRQLGLRLRWSGGS